MSKDSNQNKSDDNIESTPQQVTNTDTLEIDLADTNSSQNDSNSESHSIYQDQLQYSGVFASLVNAPGLTPVNLHETFYSRMDLTTSSLLREIPDLVSDSSLEDGSGSQKSLKSLDEEDLTQAMQSLILESSLKKDRLPGDNDNIDPNDEEIDLAIRLSLINFSEKDEEEFLVREAISRSLQDLNPQHQQKFNQQDLEGAKFSKVIDTDEDDYPDDCEMADAESSPQHSPRNPLRDPAPSSDPRNPSTKRSSKSPKRDL